MRIHSIIAAMTVMGAFTIVSCRTGQPAIPTQAGVQRFTEADLNKDGGVSREELSDHIVTEVFTSLDLNKDGKITLTEWSPGQSPATRKGFAERDLNHDGGVTLAEAKAYGRSNKIHDQVFTEADTNKDGSLSLQELTNYYASKEGPVN